MVKHEMQHHKAALPFHQISSKCHLLGNRDTETLSYHLYFIMGDCVFNLTIIIMMACPLFFCLHKTRSWNDTSRANEEKRKFWTVYRMAFVGNIVLFLSVLSAQLFFTIYWVVIDYQGVFSKEIIRNIQLFHFLSMTCYVTLLTIVKMARMKIFTGALI